MRLKRQRGSVQLSSMLLLVALAGSIYAGVQIIPVEFSNYQFQNHLAQEARIASYYGYNDARIRSAVFKNARKYNLPLRRRDIVILRSGIAVTIQVRTSVPVQLPFYRFQLKYTDNSSSAL